MYQLDTKITVTVTYAMLSEHEIRTDLISHYLPEVMQLSYNIENTP